MAPTVSAEIRPVAVFASHRNKGTCANGATIRRQEIEARVLAGLKDRLMAPELVREFIRVFHEEVNRTAAELEQRIKSDALELHSKGVAYFQ